MTSFEPISEFHLFTHRSFEYKNFMEKFRKDNNLGENNIEIQYENKELFSKYIKELKHSGLRYDDKPDPKWIDCVDSVGHFKVEYKRFTNGIFGDNGKFDNSGTTAKFFRMMF